MIPVAPPLPHPSSPRIAVLGLGYVGLPLTLAFSRHFDTLGFDIDAERVAALSSGRDRSGALHDDELDLLATARLSAEMDDLRDRDVFVVAVPTPVDRHKAPDLRPLIKAAEMVGALMGRGAVVVFESTVYPGATNEVCIPVLERCSGLACDIDFSVGYSPERVSPGDSLRRLTDIVKLTSASNSAAASWVDALYRRIIGAGTHLARDIRTAEAAKAIENTQRDVNIALVNEFAMIFARLGLDTEAVLAAAATKWNFLPFRPGLVGGHCVGVDPYYLIHKAQEAGHHPALIAHARRINDGMASYVCARLLRRMALAQIPAVNARILILGVTFKEDCPDLRNSQVGVIIDELRQYRMQIEVLDPWADPDRCESAFGLRPLETVEPCVYDVVLIALPHRQFRALSAPKIRAWLRPHGIVFDLKHLLPADAVEERL